MLLQICMYGHDVYLVVSGGGGVHRATTPLQITCHARDLFIIYGEAANYIEPMQYCPVFFMNMFCCVEWDGVRGLCLGLQSCLFVCLFIIQNNNSEF